MTYALYHLNYVAVLVVTLVGFLLGWLWYGPVLFGKAWMREMGFTEESMKADMAQSGMAPYLIKGFLFTLLSTFGLAALITAMRVPDWMTGAKFGAFVGLLGPGVRLLNGACWEKKSFKFQAITVSHELVLYTIQGAIFGCWH
jgi:Protein of unknown function (DUF1761)